MWEFVITEDSLPRTVYHSKKYFYTYNELEKMLEKTDCLVADRLYVQDDTIYDHYARYHFKRFRYIG